MFLKKIRHESTTLIRALLYDSDMKHKVCKMNWQGNTRTGSNAGKYCLGNNQSDFRISGPIRGISHSLLIRACTTEYTGTASKAKYH